MRAVFLDRDGVLNELVDGHAPFCLEDFHLKPGVVEQIARMKTAGYRIVVVSNQPDILDGKIHPLHASYMKQILLMIGVDNVYYAMRRDDYDYKPSNGALEDFIVGLGITRADSYMIGDSWKDIAAGFTSSLTTVLVGDSMIGLHYPVDKPHPDLRFRSLGEAVDFILEKK